MLIESDLPKELGNYTVMASAVICNRCFNNHLEHTPHYMLTGKTPDLSKMKVCISVLSIQNKIKKLESRCDEGIFVGCNEGSQSYLVYYPDTG